jgi:sugar phosphate isomerase/epimerase
MTEYMSAQPPHAPASPDRRVIWGIAVSDMANDLNPAYPIPDRLGALAGLLRERHAGMELQFEGHAMAVVPEAAQLAFLGIHQPTQGIDLADERIQWASFNKILQAMRLAHENHAAYMAFHLKTRDVWTDLAARRQRIEQSKRWFSKCLDMYKRRQYRFWLLAENLEYPKYPATYREILELAEDIRLLRALAGVNVGFALDVAHLWRSGFLIAENHWNHAVARDSDAWAERQIEFGAYLEQTLHAVRDVLELVHITGAKGHETHLLPGATIGSQTFEIARAYAADEIDIPRVVEVLYRAAAQRDRPLFVVNEAIGYPYERMIANCAQLACMGEKVGG